MSDSTRRDVFAGAAGLAAGTALALPAAAAEQPFRIKPSANYNEFRCLAKRIDEAHRLRYTTGNKRYDKDMSRAWKRMEALLKVMTAEPPQTANDLLDYAADPDL